MPNATEYRDRYMQSLGSTKTCSSTGHTSECFFGNFLQVIMQACFHHLLTLFPEPVVFVHYNYTENKLLQLFGRFEDLAPSHSYCDLLGLARALIDTNNPASNILYCPTRNLAIILKYWWKGEEFDISRVLELLISTGRKSEMDVGCLYHFYSGIKKHLF